MRLKWCACSSSTFLEKIWSDSDLPSLRYLMPKGPRSKNNDKPICKCRLSISNDLPDGRSSQPVVAEGRSWHLRISPFQYLSVHVISWPMTRRWNVDGVLIQLEPNWERQYTSKVIFRCTIHFWAFQIMKMTLSSSQSNNGSTVTDLWCSTRPFPYCIPDSSFPLSHFLELASGREPPGL